MSEYTTEMSMKVFSSAGFYWEIAPDSDGLGCVELFYSEIDGKKKPLTIMDTDAARAIAETLLKVAHEIDKGKKE